MNTLSASVSNKSMDKHPHFDNCKMIRKPIARFNTFAMWVSRKPLPLRQQAIVIFCLAVQFYDDYMQKFLLHDDIGTEDGTN